MHSPVQSLPVQRGVVSYSPADDKSCDAAGAGLFAGGNGVVASGELAAVPSDVGDVIGGIAKVAGPILGSLLGFI